MAIKQTEYNIKGLRQDVSRSKHSAEYAIELKNVRLTAREESTMLSVTNEKGTSFLLDLNLDEEDTIVGQVSFDDNIIVFTNTNKVILVNVTHKKHTLLITLENDYNVECVEALVSIESEALVKIYWVDGVNQPKMMLLERIINDNDEYDYIVKNESSMSFNSDLALKETFNIVQRYEGGSFSSGVIQYAFNYYNKSGQESSIVDVSPLYYITHGTRGASAEDTANNSFEITIEEADYHFDYIRVYSIHRSALDDVPFVKLLKDIKLDKEKESNKYSFTDNGLLGSAIDPSELLYKGGDFIIAKTLAQKDGTLFLGNITTNNFKLDLSKELLESWRSGNNLKWVERELNTIELKNYYPYDLTNIPGFKSRETYRLGVQFQHKSGKWSDPIFYKDSTVDQLPNSLVKDTGSTAVHKNIIAELSIPSEVKTTADAQGYIKIRPVVVFPKDSERNVIAQGILCPTIFNAETRQNGTCHSQSSWFLRPTVNRDIFGYYLTNHFSASYTANSVISKSGIIKDDEKDDSNLVSKYGAWAEFRHYYPLPHASQKNAEIATSAVGYITKKNSSLPWHYNNYAVTRLDDDNRDFTAYLDILSSEFQDSFFIDQSIVTFHSPEIELGKVTNVTNYKTRIIGAVPFDSNAGDISIEISNAGMRTGISNFYPNLYEGLTNPNYVSSNTISNNTNNENQRDKVGNGARSLIAGNFFFDSGSSDVIQNAGDGKSHIVGHAIYPWQAKTTLNAAVKHDDREEYAVLKRKQLSNLKFSAGSIYYSDSSCIDFESDVYLFSGDPIFMDIPKNLSLKNPNVKWKYSGNINMLITPKVYEQNAMDLWIATGNDEISLNSNELVDYELSMLHTKLSDDNYRLNDKELSFVKNYIHETDSAEEAKAHLLNYVNEAISGDDGMKLVLTGLLEIKFPEWPEYSYYWKGRRKYYSTLGVGENYNEKKLFSGVFNASSSSEYYTKEPIEIKYKSSPHAVISLHYKKSNVNGYNIQQILPSGLVKDDNSTVPVNIKRLLKDLDNYTYGNIQLHEIQPLEVKGRSFRNSFLWLAELYQDELANKFNGDDYLSNIWYPAGESKRLEDIDTISFTHGDTFYARFDTLKTYPYDTSTFSDVNSIVEIGSFMVETRINLDTRYDKNRGNQSNLVVNPNIFNLFNNVYDQKDTFFNYRIIDEDIVRNTKFNSTVVWSKQKFANSDTDPWTSINMTSSLNLDATNGSISKLVNFNNEIYSFQNKAISHIAFNSRIQIPTSDNNPIEITNSYKVSGYKQYSPIGNNNSLQIKNTEGGIYFINNEDRGVYVFDGESSTNISDKYGLGVWFKSQNLNSFRIDYDKLNKDIYFIGRDKCVNFSSKLDQFESFFDYNDSTIFNVADKTYAFKNNKLYELFAGEYNYFFDDYKDFYITINHNDNPYKDKIYNNIEFRADTYNWNDAAKEFVLSKNCAFNNIIVENEYQSGEDILNYLKYHASNMKRKFRIWRINIPRDSTNNRDRIRNTWTNITLKAIKPDNTKTELHDLVVNYFM